MWGQINCRLIGGWEGEKGAGKGENMGLAWRKERGNNVKGGVQGKEQVLASFLLCNWAQARGWLQLGHHCPDRGC